MASNYGNLEFGAWVHQVNGKWETHGVTQAAGDSWAWFRGSSSWNLGFLHLYPITMFLGVIVAFLTVAYFWKRMKYSWDTLYILVIIIVPTSIVGARLWFLVSSGNSEYWQHWYKLEGLSIQGGVMASGLAASAYLWFQRHHIDFRTAFGIILPAVIVGQAIGRWGNFDNHEVYGAQMSGDALNWLTFIKPHMLIMDPNTNVIAYRQPFFFYESMFNLLGYLILVWVLQRKNWVKPGVPGALYLMYYGVTRLIMEPLRDPADIMTIGWFQMSVFIAAMWIVVGFFLFVWFQGLTRPFDKWAKVTAWPVVWAITMMFRHIHFALMLFVNKMIMLMFGKKVSVWTKNRQSDLVKRRSRKISINDCFKKEYEAIYPVKPRRKFFFGEEVETKGSVLLYWGKEVPNKVKLYIPVSKEQKWSKREINQGYKNKRK